MKSLLTIACVVVLFGCNPEPDLSAVPTTPKLVIDGRIEDGAFPRVLLTTSMSYFDELDSASIRELVVTTAKVTVSTDDQSEVLTLQRDEDQFPPFVYSGTAIKGVVGKTCTLTVVWRGETYSATTTIPPVAEIDRLWFETVDGSQTKGYVYGEFTDDGNAENYYRIFTQRMSKDSRFIPVYLSAIEDEYFNGKSFTFSLLRGADNFSNIEDDLYFEKGDTVKVKFCTMDQAHFDFWRTVERELYMLGNPFASSGNDVISNIDNKKALGVWGGYGVKHYVVVAR